MTGEFRKEAVSLLRQPLSAENLNDETPSRTLPFTLSWTHYVQLLKIENEDERNFYEIEASQNNWSVRVLARKYNSAIYERLALSMDKEGVKQLAQKGQIIEKPTDFLKSHYVLESWI